MSRHWGFGFTKREMLKIQEVRDIIRGREMKTKNELDGLVLSVAGVGLDCIDIEQPINKIYPKDKVMFFVYAGLGFIHKRIEEWCFAMGYWKK